MTDQNFLLDDLAIFEGGFDIPVEASNDFSGLPFAPPEKESESDFTLEVVQQPQHGRVAMGKEKDRKPLDPPPFVLLNVSRKKDPNQNYLQSPYYFMSCSLIKNNPEDEDIKPNALLGSVVSSLHRLKNQKNGDSAYFIFGDLSVKNEGKYKLLFLLYQINGNECTSLASIVSNTFEVFPAKSFPGLMESTYLTRSFSDQGVRLRIRKDSRSITTRKRNQSVAEFAAAHEGPQASNSRAEHGSLAMRQNGVEDGSGHFGNQSPSYYGGQPGMMQQHNGLKRKRPEDDTGAPTLDAMAGYPQRHGYHQGLHPLQIPNLATTTTGFSMQSPATAPPVPFGHHPLSRLDTSMRGGAPAPSSTPNSAHPYQSPHMRQSPHNNYMSYSSMQSPAHAQTMTFSSAPTSAAIHPQHLGSPHASDFRSLSGTMFGGQPGVEGSPRNTSHNVNPNASSSTSPSEANYTAATPQEPYASVGSGHPYSYPPQGLGVSADPRNASILNMGYHDSNSVHASGQSTGYHSGPSTTASAYQDNDRSGNAYQDTEKANDSQQ